LWKDDIFHQQRETKHRGKQKREKEKERKEKVHTWVREKVLWKDEERNPSTYSGPGIV
jgi:hypothetical protein